MTNWTRSGIKNPCFLCGRTKDADCIMSSNGEFVQCHTAGKETYPEKEINGYVFTGKFTDVGGSLRCANYVIKREKVPTKIINQTLTGKSKGATVVLVEAKQESVVEVISLARHYQEPSLKVDNTIIHNYNSTNRLLRIEKPTLDSLRIAAGKSYEKTFVYQHFDGTNWIKGEDKKNPITEAYRWTEQKDSLKANDYLLTVEGETNAEAFNAVGLAAVTFRKWNIVEKTSCFDAAKQNNLTFVFLEDNDAPGKDKGKKLQEICDKHKINYINLTMADLGWPDAPLGADGKDFIERLQQDKAMNNQQIQEELVRLITEAIRQKKAGLVLAQVNPVNPGKPQEQQEKPTDTPLDKITQIVLYALYTDTSWICVRGDLYKWVGTHYELQKTVQEERRIAEYLNKYSVDRKYPYATPSFVRTCLSWVKMFYSISPEKINPPGINCLNGVVRINWVDFQPTPELIPHSPDQYYISEPTFKYDPKADATDCHRLLEALDPNERTIFLRTVAASLDLTAVRKRWGRLIKALLCVGDGSNGKDALRECVASLHGKGLTGCSLKDFSAYDGGRKFPIARLSTARCNWSSENILHGKLDTVQSLKAAITGEPLSCEPKGKDEEEFTPKTIFLFNCNEAPKVQGHQQAFVSRYGILNFRKTFKIGANTAAGELEADPRFKYDPSFLKAQVMPAFLNIALAELANLMSDGINYTSVEKAMEEARSESNHLYQMCQDIGLVAAKGEEIMLREGWAAAYNWYLNNGYVEETEDGKAKVKKVWITDIDQGDPLVKASNQLLKGLKRVFGNSLKSRVGTGGVSYLVGVKFERSSSLPHCEPLETACDKALDPQAINETASLSSSLISELPHSEPLEPAPALVEEPQVVLNSASQTASLSPSPAPDMVSSPTQNKPVTPETVIPIEVNTKFEIGERVIVSLGGYEFKGTFKGCKPRTNDNNKLDYLVLLDGKDVPFQYDRKELKSMSEAVVLTSEAVSEADET